MVTDATLEQYLSALIEGNRTHCRTIIEEALQSGTLANSVYVDIIWPIMVEIEGLLRADRITPSQEHLASRINRTIVDQLQNKLPRRPSVNKKIVICCAQNETQELGAQIIADLFESNGWEVRFLGGGLTNDDLLTFVNEYGPDILLIYGTTPKQTPSVRQFIDTIKSVAAWPNMRVMVCGGIFNRAEGLWQEIGADLFAATAAEVIQTAQNSNTQTPHTTAQTQRQQKMLVHLSANLASQQ